MSGFYIIPNYLRDEINEKLDEQIVLEPGAEKDRKTLYQQILNYVIEHGVIPSFTLKRNQP